MSIRALQVFAEKCHPHLGTRTNRLNAANIQAVGAKLEEPSLDRTIILIAAVIASQFSTKYLSVLNIPYPPLKDRCLAFLDPDCYPDIVDKVCRGVAIPSNHRVVNEFLNTYKGGYTGPSRDQVKQEQVEHAILSSDHLAAFHAYCDPQCMEPFLDKLRHPPGIWKALWIYLCGILRGEENSMGEALNPYMNRFVFKEVALFRKGKDFTRADLAREWVQITKQKPRFEKLKDACLLGWLCPTGITVHKPQREISFENYVCEQTLEAFKSIFSKVTLSSEAEKKLLERMKDEAFRMGVVFYMGNMTSLIERPPLKSNKAYYFLMEVHRFYEGERDNWEERLNLPLMTEEGAVKKVEERLGFSLESDLCENLLEAMKVEEFRRQLILGGAQKHRWSVAIRCFENLKKIYVFSGTSIFRWIFNAAEHLECRAFADVSMPPLNPKPSLDPAIEIVAKEVLKPEMYFLYLLSIRSENDLESLPIAQWEKSLGFALTGDARAAWFSAMQEDEEAMDCRDLDGLVTADHRGGNRWLLYVQRLLRLQQYNLTPENKALVFDWICNAREDIEIRAFDECMGAFSPQTDQHDLNACVRTLKQAPVEQDVRFVTLLKYRDSSPKDLPIKKLGTLLTMPCEKIPLSVQKKFWVAFECSKFQIKFNNFIAFFQAVSKTKPEPGELLFLAIYRFVRLREAGKVSDAYLPILLEWIVNANTTPEIERFDDRTIQLSVSIDGMIQKVSEQEETMEMRYLQLVRKIR